MAHDAKSGKIKELPKLEAESPILLPRPQYLLSPAVAPSRQAAQASFQRIGTYQDGYYYDGIDLHKIHYFAVQYEGRFVDDDLLGDVAYAAVRDAIDSNQTNVIDEQSFAPTDPYNVIFGWGWTDGSQVTWAWIAATVGSNGVIYTAKYLKDANNKYIRNTVQYQATDSINTYTHADNKYHIVIQCRRDNGRYIYWHPYAPTT